MTQPARAAWLHRRWLRVYIYITVILITLPLAPILSKYLRNWIELDKLVFIVLVGFLLLMLLFFLRSKPSHRLMLLLVFTPLGIITLWLAQQIRLPIERIHIIEYGILSVMIYRALGQTPKYLRTGVIALVVTGIIGSIDEGIQHLLPNRFFALSDIMLNGLGGIAGLVYYGTYRWITSKP